MPKEIDFFVLFCDKHFGNKMCQKFVFVTYTGYRGEIHIILIGCNAV